MEPWEIVLAKRAEPGSLLQAAREGRLARDSRRGVERVHLSWIDEACLALVDAAIRRRRNLNLVYPAPAGEIAALLAAQILIQMMRRGEPHPSVGIVSGDPPRLAACWSELRIVTTGVRVPIAEAFPCFRASPEGEGPAGGRPVRGTIIGQRFAAWPVGVVVMDHLSGPVFGEPDRTTIRIHGDPLHPDLSEREKRGESIWGWSDHTLALWHDDAARPSGATVPFSVAQERLAAISRGVTLRVSAQRDPESEACIRRVREDLNALGALLGPNPPRRLAKGIRLAWHHLSALTSLPCSPSRHDAFAGWPPRAARETRSFGREIEAWSRTLDGEARDYAFLAAGDLEDLRAALERRNPLRAALDARRDAEDTLVITRTRTAARALLAELGGDPDADPPRAGGMRFASLSTLHRLASRQAAIIVGGLPPWDWHRIDSGVASRVEVLVIGSAAARSAVAHLQRLRDERRRWGSLDQRRRAWSDLVGDPAPGDPFEIDLRLPPIEADIPEQQHVDDSDPFELLARLFRADPLVVGDEGIDEAVAMPVAAGDRWIAEVEAVEIVTDRGTIRLPRDRIVEIREGDRILEQRADRIRPGVSLLVGRRSHRLGLLEALEDRLADRPDLLASRYLTDDFREKVQLAFRRRPLTVAALHRALAALGCEKTAIAVSSWVAPEGAMAPRDFEDVERLSDALDLRLSPTRLRETFAAIQRRRTFRRAAGRALAQAARQAAATADDGRIDEATGLSSSDLRDAVLDALVLETRLCPEPVPLADVGHLEAP